MNEITCPICKKPIYANQRGWWAELLKARVHKKCYAAAPKHTRDVREEK